MEQGDRPVDKLTTEPPDVTADDFEEYLLTDNLLSDYFNMFLSLMALVSDHKLLLDLFKEDKAIPPIALTRIPHWVLILIYEYTFKHGPGTHTVNTLSQLTLQESVAPPPVPQEIVMALNFQDTLPVSAKQIKYWISQDPLLSKNFPMPIWFNKEMETFEIVDNAKKNLLRQLKRLVNTYSPMDPIYDVTVKSRERYPQFKKKITALDLKFENKFTVKCLDQVQGIAWIKNERLPTFLMSDCYFEYRLAKLLSQLECKTGLGVPQIDSTYRPWDIEKESTSTIVDLVEATTEEMHTSYDHTSYDHTSYEEGSDIASLYSEASNTQTEELFTEIAEEAPIMNIPAEDHDISIVNEVMLSITTGRMLTEPRKLQRRKQNASKPPRETCDPGAPKPIIVDDKLFEFVPAYPLQGRETIFLGEMSESAAENFPKGSKKAKEVVRIDDKASTYTEIRIKDETRMHKERATADVEATAQRAETGLSDEAAQKSHVSQPTKLDGQQPSAVQDGVKTEVVPDSKDEESTETDSSNEAGDIRDICFATPRHSSNFKSRKGVEKFKRFLQGTAGEKYWWLWMDIERLKVIKDGKMKQSYLNKIRNRYLFNGGEYCMNAETRAKLCLSFVSQWTVENLCQVQSDIVAPLLLYWGPRYCINQGFPIRQAGIVLKDWEDRQLRPKPDKQPKNTCKPRHRQRKVPQNKRSPKRYCTGTVCKTTLRKQESKNQLPPSIDSIWSQASKAMKDLEDLELRKAKDLRNLETLMQIKKYHEDLCDSKIDNLLQALHNESRTGHYFTRFCEETGNVLWSNAVNLWFDLKEYQRLFYAEIFQPFKLKRQAQFIFATYTVEGAPADVQMDAENKKEIYSKLEPPFEELFDQLEEHTLLLLLVPWIQMIEAEMVAYSKVKVSTKTRYLDTIYNKKLLELQRKILPHDEIPLPMYSPSQEEITDDSKNAWQMVPTEFRNYTFNTILHNRLELDQFQMFLRENLADMDLNCWLDIDYYMTITYNDKKNKDIKSKEIINKYLNRKYFFGPSSPATKEQQNEVLALAGGREALNHEQLSSEVAMEVQRYAKERIENKWLPMFLSTSEFAADHHIRIKLQEVVEDQMLHKSRKKRDVMKHMDNKWTASSKEIIAFRKALLNPVTALLFRKYVSSKGALMENNVLFWLEVQKYKDLCHSHASEETIQNKITVIINCFINSNIPPTVQITIPEEYASTIINHREEQGPYIFREAQMAVFDILFKLWPEFSDFRRRLAVESNLSELEERSMKDQELMQSKITDKTLDMSKDGRLQPAKPLHSLDTGSRSSGSQLSLKGGSDKATQDQSEMKAGSAGTVQGSKQSQKLSWSFSKYIEALNRQEALIKRARDADRKESPRHDASRMDSVESAPINIIPPDSSSENIPNNSKPN
ncbi:regulator of G-protein signaling 22 [Mustelus asterias]